MSSIFGQVFQISNVGQRQFTLNKFDKIVYARDENTGNVYEYNLKTNSSKESAFPSLPVFANKSRKAVYEDAQQLYLYDLDKNTTTLLGSTSNYLLYFTFSPNDLCLLIGESDTLKSIFLTKTEIKKNTIGIAEYWDLHPVWTSDSTLIFTRIGMDILYHYNLNSQKRYTLIDLSAINSSLLGFDYNNQIDGLTYSYEYVYNKKIILQNMKTKNESIIVDYARDFKDDKATIPFGFTSLKWSPDWKKLSFFGYWFTNSISSIFTYYLDSNKTKLNTKWDDYGRKRDTEWLNNDTIVFNNMTLFEVDGFSIPKIYSSIINEKGNIFTYPITLSNYPNPFNNSTILEFTSNESGEADLKIYNILGQIVYSTNLGKIIAGKHSYRWNGINQSGRVLSSGVYIALIKFRNYYNEKYLLSKKLQLIK